MENRNYENGYTSRNWINTDTDKVSTINKFTQEQKESVLDYVTRVISNLSNSRMRNPLAKEQALIMTELITATQNESEQERLDAEGEIQKMIYKHDRMNRNKLSGWTSQQRQNISDLTN